MYKTQIACAILIFFIGVFYFSTSGHKKRSSKWFSTLLVCSFLQLLFDVISVYTVNHLETVSPVLNRVVHIFYMGLMLSLFYIAYKYLETMIEEEISKSIKRYNFTIIPLLITLAGVIFLPLSYIESPVSNYSYGPAAYMTYIGVAIYLFLIIRLMVQYGKMMSWKKKRAIFIALVSEIPVAIYQIIVPESLITCLGIVLLNLGIYITTENPDALLAEQLEKEKQRADTANAAKTNFLANMSHEIRTPITAVLGMNELILRESKDASVRQYARDIEGAAKSLLSIINDILDITKIEAGKLSVITAEYDFAAVINDVVNMISFKAKVKNLAFLVEVDERIPGKLLGDDIRLRQILVNLLNNAVKYTHEGSVTLEIRMLSMQENKAEISFAVKDTGIGIKNEDMQKLCKPFERIEEKRNRNIEGTGLGMSITKQLLDLLNSKLEVSSVYGKGSEFSFVLYQEIADAEPIGSLEKQTELKDEEYQHAFEAPDAKILVVDDNELNRRVFVGLLKATKVEIEEAGSGRECLEKVMQKKYDIIFLDHMMPEMDGLETFRIMKEREDYPSKNSPVVILTANAIVGAKEKYMKEGFTAFLTKPIDYIKLENLIKELLDASLVQAASSKTVEMGAGVELPMVEGLDWNYAKLHFPDEQTMLDTVAFFAKSIVYDTKELEGLFEHIATESGRTAYCTKVHSMKNSAMTIGIVPLAGMAKVLEDAARGGDMQTLEAMTPIFLTSWRGFTEKLSECGGEETTRKKPAEEFKEEIAELVANIRQAAEGMDIDELDKALELLEEYEFHGMQLNNFENIRQAIVNFDVDYLQGAVL